MHHGFTGNLSSDSPNLWRRLRQIYPDASILRFSDAYGLSALNGGVSEYPVDRAPDASFNPKPARLCEILIKECSERRQVILIAAIFLPSNLTDNSTPASVTSFEHEIALAKEAKMFTIHGQSALPDAQRLGLTLVLDELRHMHMWTISAQATLARLKEIQERVLLSADPCANERLLTLAGICAGRIKALLHYDTAA